MKPPLATVARRWIWSPAPKLWKLFALLRNVPSQLCRPRLPAEAKSDAGRFDAVDRLGNRAVLEEGLLEGEDVVGDDLGAGVLQHGDVGGLARRARPTPSRRPCSLSRARCRR